MQLIVKQISEMSVQQKLKMIFCSFENDNTEDDHNEHEYVGLGAQRLLIVEFL